MSADSMQGGAEAHGGLDAAPAELGDRWRRAVVLKRDIFSIVERGTYRGPDGDVDAVARRIDQVPWWTFVFARNFLAREERALTIVGPLGIAPLLYFAGKRVLVRRWIDGVPLHIARPVGDRAYFRSARQVLRKLHTAGFCHNDLAKEQNWLRGTMAAPTSPTSSFRRSRAGAAISSGSPPTKTCATTSSTSAATSRRRSPRPSGAFWRARPG